MSTSKSFAELDRSSRQIRLLRLQPGKFNAGVCGSISLVSLNDHPTYEALSYVWGDAAVKIPIDLDGTSFKVTKNLELALRHLRHETEVRTLWVDAVCINQENVQERNHQVGLMRDIYQHSAKVLVWFGPANDRHRWAVKAVEAVYTQPDLHWTTMDPSSRAATAMGKAKSKFGGLLGAQPPTVEKINLWDVFTFLKSQWWERMWVVQEYVLAKEVDFISGSEVISGAKLVALGEAFLHHQSECCPEMDEGSRVGLSSTVARQMITILEMERLREEKKRLDFLELASLYRLRTTTDLHDKVYGLLSLASESGQVTVDYGLSTSQAYEDAAVSIIRTTSNLDILSHIVDHRPPPGWNPRNKDEEVPPPPVAVPSWVSNWSADLYPEVTEAVRVRMTKLRYFSASGDRGPVIVQHSSGKITLLGTVVDVIKQVGRAQDQRRSSTFIINEWRDLAGIDREPEKPYVDNKSIWFDAFWKSLILDVGLLNNQRANEETRAVHDAWWWSFLVDLYNASKPGAERKETSRYSQKGGLGHGLNYFQTDVSRSISQRRFFISHKGYIGVVPAKAEPGDLICVLYGGKMPYILRDCRREGSPDESSGQSAKEFTFLGDSYVHGVMDGEVMTMLANDQLKEQEFVLV